MRLLSHPAVSSLRMRSRCRIKSSRETDADIGASSNHFEGCGHAFERMVDREHHGVLSEFPQRAEKRRFGEHPCCRNCHVAADNFGGFQSLTSPLNAVARASRRQSRYGRVSPVWPSKNFNFGITLKDPAEDEAQSMRCWLDRLSQTLPLPESLRAEFELRWRRLALSSSRMVTAGSPLWRLALRSGQGWGR